MQDTYHLSVEKAAVSMRGFLPFSPLFSSVFLCFLLCSVLQDRRTILWTGRESRHLDTEFQNGKGWKGAFLGSSGPSYLLKQCPLKQSAQDCIQAVFECLQGWRLHNLFQCRVPHTANLSLQSQGNYQQVSIPYSLGRLPTIKR